MHGDLHIFNLVCSGDGYRLIDWEHFHKDGSFVYDYLDFHLSVLHIGAGKPWHRVLSGIAADHPCIRTVSQRFGIDPRALLAYYLFLKSDTIIARSSRPGLTWDSKFAPLLTCLRAAVARLAPLP